MPDIGSYVIYGANGICIIKDKRKEKMSGTKNEYFILEPVDNPYSKIFVPTSNNSLLNKMKTLLNAEEILALINDIGNDGMSWIADNKTRAELFSSIIETGDRKELLKLIKCIYLKRKELSDEHKKLWAADEATLKTAEKMINAEFGLVLGINADDVPAFIERTLNT